ncbi:MAG: nucleotidyltransferase domain-containing protein [Suipraeoptans sp.]
MSERLKIFLDEYRKSVKNIFGETEFRIILYGSYARGDFTETSDIDIMIIVDSQPEKISFYADRIYDITYDYELKYNKEINPNVQSCQIYERWKNVYPFFANIEKDGIAV